MATAAVEAIGLKKLRRKLDRLEDRARTQLERRAVFAAGRDFRRRLEGPAPVSITMVQQTDRKTRRPIAKVGPSDPAGLWLEYGTGLYYTGPVPGSKRTRALREKITPKRHRGIAASARALGSGRRGFGPVASVPGMHPRPWLRPAIARNRGRAAKAGRDELRRMLKTLR